MEIIMIKTQTDYDEVTTKLTAESVSTSLQFWIGLKWDTVQQDFYWIDNTILAWSYWCYEGSTNSNEPDCMTSSSRPCISWFEDDQNCVRLTHSQQSAWCFATRPCDADYNTMCRGLSGSAETTTSTTTIHESTEAAAITTVHTNPETPTTQSQTTSEIQTTTALTTTRESTEAETTTIYTTVPANPETTTQPQTTLESKTTITTPTIKESTEADVTTTQSTVPVAADTTTNPPHTSGSSIQCLYAVTLHTNQNIAIEETTSTYLHQNGTALTCPVMKCHVISYATIQSDPDTYLYKVQKDDISSYRRKLTCASDDRVSSSIFGYTAAVVVISLVFFVPVLVDLISFCEKYSKNKDQQYMER